MSDATFQLLTSTEFMTAIVIGAIGVAIAAALALVVSRPFPFGGIVLAVGILFALERLGRIPDRLVLGIALVAVVGLIPTKSRLLAMAIVAPGAIVVGMANVADGNDTVVWIVAATIVLLAPLVAAFDDQFATSALATPLLAISMVSVFLTVPDTELVLLAAGASLPWLVVGPPARLARLGRSGAYAASALLVWLVFSGGSARTVALVAGVATLGMLIVQPVVATLAGGEPTHRAKDEPADMNVMILVVAAHIAIQALVAIAVRI